MRLVQSQFERIKKKFSGIFKKNIRRKISRIELWATWPIIRIFIMDHVAHLDLNPKIYKNYFEIL